MSTVTVAATQMTCGWDRDANIDQAEALIREAAGEGAQIVLLQELFETPYFPQEMKAEYFDLARPAADHPMLARMSALAAELNVVLPVSFFERANNATYNSLMIIDADGAQLGVYRKSHIPHAPRYEEKYYFTPGDIGFRVWQTRHATIGAAICWDQWFPEAARCMALQGADILFYPTAIGSDPVDTGGTSSGAWQRVMQGHAVANSVAVVASNRIGRETANGGAINFIWIVVRRRRGRATNSSRRAATKPACSSRRSTSTACTATGTGGRCSATAARPLRRRDDQGRRHAIRLSGGRSGVPGSAAGTTPRANCLPVVSVGYIRYDCRTTTTNYNDTPGFLLNPKAGTPAHRGAVMSFC